MLAAAETFTTKGNFGPGNRKRVKAMILLLRYSGLRISDASTLERSRVNGTRLFLYTQKTGTPVRLPLPQTVVDALAESPSEDEHYFFWNGRCLRTSAVKIWETTFKTVFEKAEIKERPHPQISRHLRRSSLGERRVDRIGLRAARPLKHRHYVEALSALGEVASGQA